MVYLPFCIGNLSYCGALAYTTIMLGPAQWPGGSAQSFYGLSYNHIEAMDFATASPWDRVANRALQEASAGKQQQLQVQVDSAVTEPERGQSHAAT